MKDLGRKLARAYLNTAWRAVGDDWDDKPAVADVQALLFSTAREVRSAHEFAKLARTKWTSAAKLKADAWLVECTKHSEPFVSRPIPPDCATELWRRWQFGLVSLGLELELDSRADLDLAVPMTAPLDVKNWAGALYVLGGPAKKYPAGLT